MLKYNLLRIRHNLLIRVKKYYKHNMHLYMLNSSILYCTYHSMHSPGYPCCYCWQTVNNSNDNRCIICNEETIMSGANNIMSNNGNN